MVTFLIHRMRFYAVRIPLEKNDVECYDTAIYRSYRASICRSTLNSLIAVVMSKRQSPFSDGSVY